MHITLQKRDKGQTCLPPILDQGQLDPYTINLEHKHLMLQIFQEEFSRILGYLLMKFMACVLQFVPLFSRLAILSISLCLVEFETD